MSVAWIIVAICTVAFLARAGVLARAGRPEEARTYRWTGLAIGVSVAAFVLIPVDWRRPVLLVAEGALALAEAALLVTWPMRRRRAGEKKSRVDSSRWKGFAVIGLAACFSLVSDVLAAGGRLDVIMAGIIAALSLALAALERSVGVQITTQGVLRATQFVPWTAIADVRREADGMVLISRRPFATWRGFGWSKIRGSEEELADLKEQARAHRSRERVAP